VAYFQDRPNPPLGCNISLSGAGVAMFDGRSVGTSGEPDRDRWYWGRDRRTKQLIGVGKFMGPTELVDHWSFWINGQRYDASNFEFHLADVPPCIDSVRPRIPWPSRA